MERSGFRIYFAKYEQYETKEGSRKSRIFLLKVLFLELSNYNHFSLSFSLSLTLLIFLFYIADVMLHVFGLLKLSLFDHMWTLHSGKFRRPNEQVIANKELYLHISSYIIPCCEAFKFRNKTYP